MKLWKESLNSDGQQFHQYQQNEQSPLTLTHWTQKREHNIWHWKSMSPLGTGKKCGKTKPVNGILNSPLLITGFPKPYKMYIYKQTSTFRFASTQKTTYYHKALWQNKHGHHKNRVKWMFVVNPLLASKVK